jgi:hypothetical protein
MSDASYIAEVSNANLNAPDSTDPQESKKGTGKVDIYMILCGGLIIIAAVIGIVFAVTSKSDSTATSNGVADDEEVSIRSKLEYLSSDPSIFDDNSSPQYKALRWLKNKDEAVVNGIEQVRLETRFALATLFFATRGEKWFQPLNFLSSDHECNWTSSLTEKGVTCDGNDRVTTLEIGTYLETSFVTLNMVIGLRLLFDIGFS